MLSHGAENSSLYNWVPGAARLQIEGRQAASATAVLERDSTGLKRRDFHQPLGPYPVPKASTRLALSPPATSQPEGLI